MGHIVVGHECPKCGSHDIRCSDKEKMIMGCIKCDWVGPFEELNEEWLIFKEKCDICHDMKEDVRLADTLNKRICSDCMCVEKFSDVFVKEVS